MLILPESLALAALSEAAPPVLIPIHHPVYIVPLALTALSEAHPPALIPVHHPILHCTIGINCSFRGSSTSIDPSAPSNFTLYHWH